MCDKQLTSRLGVLLNVRRPRPYKLKEIIVFLVVQRKEFFLTRAEKTFVFLPGAGRARRGMVGGPGGFTAKAQQRHGKATAKTRHKQARPQPQRGKNKARHGKDTAKTRQKHSTGTAKALQIHGQDTA